MPVSKYSLVTYRGLDVGSLYLEDVQQRSQLGAGQQRVIGQDIVINFSDEITLVNTGAVLMSQEAGILSRFTKENDPQVAKMAEAKGVKVFYDVQGNPTGLAAPITITGIDDLAGATGTSRVGTAGTKADPAKTIGDF